MLNLQRHRRLDVTAEVKKLDLKSFKGKKLFISKVLGAIKLSQEEGRALLKVESIRESVKGVASEASAAGVPRGKSTPKASSSKPLSPKAASGDLDSSMISYESGGLRYLEEALDIIPFFKLDNARREAAMPISIGEQTSNDARSRIKNGISYMCAAAPLLSEDSGLIETSDLSNILFGIPEEDNAGGSASFRLVGSAASASAAGAGAAISSDVIITASDIALSGLAKAAQSVMRIGAVASGAGGAATAVVAGGIYQHAINARDLSEELHKAESRALELGISEETIRAIEAHAVEIESDTFLGVDAGRSSMEFKINALTHEIKILECRRLDDEIAQGFIESFPAVDPEPMILWTPSEDDFMKELRERILVFPLPDFKVLDIESFPVINHTWEDYVVFSEGGDRTSKDPLRRHPQSAEPIPDAEASGRPHTQLGTRTSKKGYKYKQAREFDEEGKPVKDIHFTDHNRPRDHTNPHQHRYIENKTGGSRKRLGAEALSKD